MTNWLKRLTGRAGAGAPVVRTAAAAPVATLSGPTFPVEFAPEFSTRLAVDSVGAPGRAGAEALYQKWASRWQEF